MFFKKPTIREPVVTRRTPPKDILHWPKICLASPVLSSLVLLPVFSRAFHLMSLPQILPFLPSLLSYFLSSRHLLWFCVALFDFLTECLIIWSLLSPAAQSLEFPWTREILAASDHSFLFDGGEGCLWTHLHRMYHIMLDKPFLHFPPKNGME